MPHTKTSFFIKYIFLFLFLCIFGIFFSRETLAAEITLTTLGNTYAEGQEFKADVYVNTEELLINVLQGEIVFSSDHLELTGFSTGKSIVPLWIEPPQESPKGTVSFAGAIPGGKKTESGYLFSLTFLVKTPGNTSIRIQNVQVIEHAADPRQYTLTEHVKTLELVTEGSITQATITIHDQTPPEAFTPLIATGAELFDGRYFIVFNTTDADTGIDHYEILETTQYYETYQLEHDSTLQWREVKNPVVLEDQTRNSYVYLKAIDRAGNARIAILEPTGDLSTKQQYKYLDVLGILVVLVLILLLARKLYRRR